MMFRRFPNCTFFNLAENLMKYTANVQSDGLMRSTSTMFLVVQSLLSRTDARPGTQVSIVESVKNNSGQAHYRLCSQPRHEYVS